MTPPPELSSYVGGGHFSLIGNEFLGYFRELCDLKPDESVLDIGCGIGRMAIPLTKYLDGAGKYEGFDIVRSGIDWCTENISSRYSNFHFRLADIYNSTYNPSGKGAARDFIFPFPGASFDFVFLTSVFTHMLPDDLDHYLSEISRVLKKQGRLLVTFYLLNGESSTLIRRGKSNIDFKYSDGVCKYDSETTKECQVAYNEKYISNLFKSKDLIVREPIYYGFWCGRAGPSVNQRKGNVFSYQDIIIADKS